MTLDPKFIQFRAADGVLIAARDWRPEGEAEGVVLCLHGLTRNSRDFQVLAADLGRRYRVIAPDQRGRGMSAYADPSTYVLPVQLQDTLALLDHLGVDRCVVIGTSMGALMAVALAATAPDRIAGVVLNDAGPEVDPRGLARIAGYVGEGTEVRTWRDAVKYLRTIHGQAYPTYADEDWERMARATYAWSGDGLRLDYDPRLRESFAAGATAGPDMWPLFEALRAVPSLIIRGEQSDILSAATAVEVTRRFGSDLASVRDRGHAPDLNEPEALQAIHAFLLRPEVGERVSPPATVTNR